MLQQPQLHPMDLISRILAGALGLLLLANPTLGTPTYQRPGEIPQDGEPPAEIKLAARYEKAFVTYRELDALILSRFAQSKLGRETRLFMLKLRVVDSIGRELGVQASPAEVNAMRDEFEASLIAAEQAKDLDSYLKYNGVSKKEFIESLRVAVLQAKLARIDLGIPPDDPVSGEQQEMWIEAQISERGLEELPAPWQEGVVLRNGDVEIQRDEFIEFLRGRLDPADIYKGLLEILRVKLMKDRMPDLDPQALERAIDEEIQNRRREVQSDPRYKGIPYEQLLESQGILFDSWHRDPNVQTAALARLWVRRKYKQEDMLREVYENERQYFDGLYGEAIEASVFFLRASSEPNELIPRTYSEAEELLAKIAKELEKAANEGSTKAAFEARVDLMSENPASRKRKGYLGWITREGSSGPNPARAAIFEAYDSGAWRPADPENSITRLVGPVRTSEGVLLLWLGDRRPAPTWNSMVVYVHKELRQRFIDEVLDERHVQTYTGPK